MNIKVVLEYDGTQFSGWQQQTQRRTVEGELKRALRELAGRDHVVYAAGRTDAGAHAAGQVVSFEWAGKLQLSRLRSALNALLPGDVSVVSAEEVPTGFHARYSARWRRYRYRYLDRPARPAIGRGHCWHVGRPLDDDLMTEAATALVGRHDWSSFCAASEPVGSRIREMRTAEVSRRGSLVDLDLVAEGFLRGLARGIAGALAEVGLGRKPPKWPAEVLRAKDRSLAPRTAPARGLTLMEVYY